MPAPGELTYFQQIGEEGRQHSINKPFSDSETPRFFMDMGAIFSLLPPPPARVLDCGCGTGWMSYFLSRKGYDVVGQDCSKDAIELARANPVFLKEGKAKFVCSDFEDLGYQDEFDAVLFYSSLHHSQQEAKAIQNAYLALKPDGVFLAIEPGCGHAASSQVTVQEFEVAERDMPPHLVVKAGKKAGFREARIYQHPGQLISTLYGSQPHSALLRKLWQLPGARILSLLASLLFFKRFNGLVWMRK